MTDSEHVLHKLELFRKAFLPRMSHGSACPNRSRFSENSATLLCLSEELYFETFFPRSALAVHTLSSHVKHLREDGVWENSLGSDLVIPVIVSLLGNLPTYTSSVLHLFFLELSLAWLQRRIRRQISQKAKAIKKWNLCHRDKPHKYCGQGCVRSLTLRVTERGYQDWSTSLKFDFVTQWKQKFESSASSLNFVTFSNTSFPWVSRFHFFLTEKRFLPQTWPDWLVGHQLAGNT